MVGMQQFNLRWNNYTSNILQVFSEHLSSESLVDVTLSCQGRFIRAHKIILSACSPYFQEVFANHTDKHPVIILKGIKYEDLQSMIKFMYNGEIRVHEAQLDDLLAAAELLQVKGLSNVRSKYERGEITSLNPPSKPVSAKSSDSGAARKDQSTHSLKAGIAMFAPTATTARAPNTTATSLKRANTPGKDAIIPVTVAKSDTMTLIPASTFHAANLTTPSVRPALAIATLVPSNTIIPLRDGNNWIRSSATGATSNFTLSTNAAASSAITVSTISRDPAIGASLISSTSTTPSLDTPIITCVTGNFVDPNDSETASNEIAVNNADNVPIGHLTRLVPINTATGVVQATEKKPVTDGQALKVRKRRKTSHIVNELAKETVFASNGTVLLEPDDAVGKNRTKTSQSSTSLLSQSSSTSAELEEITVKKMRVKIQAKSAQESLLIKEGERKPEKIPRPPNAFMIFANEWRRKLAVEHPKENNKKISVRLGIMWKGLSIKAKETYYKLAKKADEEHKTRYPGYYYSPKEARMRKTLRHSPSKRPTKLLTSGKNMDDLQMLEAFINGEDREIVQFTDSSDYDEDDYEDVELEEDEEEYDDDVILDEYTDDEDDPQDQNSQSCAKRKDSSASSSGKANASKT